MGKHLPRETRRRAGLQFFLETLLKEWVFREDVGMCGPTAPDQTQWLIHMSNKEETVLKKRNEKSVPCFPE